MFQYFDNNENCHIAYSIISGLIISFMTGVAVLRNELIFYSEPSFNPFKMIYNVDTLEKLNEIGKITFCAGVISGLILTVSIRMRKKTLLILACVLYNAIFISNAFILGSYQFLILKFLIGWCIAICTMVVPIYIQKQVEGSKIDKLVLLNALFLSIGLLMGEISYQYNRILCRSSLIFLLTTLFIRDPCKLSKHKCLLMKEVLNNSTAYCAILVTTFYGVSSAFLEITPLKNDKLFYTIRSTCLLFEICFIDFIDRKFLILTSNLLVVIMLGIRMSIGENLILRECLIWAYSGGIYPVRELLFSDLYPKKYIELGLFLKSIVEILAYILISNINWDYKKSFISSVFLLAISAFIYKEPFETMKREKKW